MYHVFKTVQISNLMLSTVILSSLKVYYTSTHRIYLVVLNLYDFVQLLKIYR